MFPRHTLEIRPTAQISQKAEEGKSTALFFLRAGAFFPNTADASRQQAHEARLNGASAEDLSQIPYSDEWFFANTERWFAERYAQREYDRTNRSIIQRVGIAVFGRKESTPEEQAFIQDRTEAILDQWHNPR